MVMIPVDERLDKGNTSMRSRSSVEILFALQVVRFVVLATIVAVAALWLINYFLDLLGAPSIMTWPM